MKTTNYRLQTEIEHLSPTGQKEWFENYIRQVLENNKPYYAKADYIGLSFAELQNKIDYIASDIKELQQLKKRLTQAKDIAQEVTASILLEYGIDRLDGTAISSLTITPHKTKTKEKIIIKNEDTLLQLGYAKVSVDQQALEDAMLTLEGLEEIDKFIEIQTITEETPARLKINVRRSSTRNQAIELLNITDAQIAAERGIVMFNNKQNQVLAYELDNSRIKSRSKGNITLSYLEGFDIIETANKIFGYGNWEYSISTLEQVSQELNKNQNHIICYKAVVQIKVYDEQHITGISRQDVGFGTGIATTMADAHEGAAKEAVTDAIKRSFRSFGNQFGNSLYDKSRQHQNQSPNYQQPIQQLQQPSQTQHQQSHNPQDYSSLYSLGLTIMEQGQNLVVLGDDIFAKKDSIKACGFRWDGTLKLWYKPIEQQAA